MLSSHKIPHGFPPSQRAQAVDRSLKLAFETLTESTLAEPVPEEMLKLIAQIDAKLGRRH